MTFFSLKNDKNVTVFRIRIRIRIRIGMFLGFLDQHLDPLIPGYGSEDPDRHPEPYQNVRDPQH
jgi:hypothetical protein